MNPALIIAISAAIIGPLLTYLSSARRLSGRITTSEAASLWQESSSIREDYRTQIKALNRIIARCESRITELEKINKELNRENNNLINVVDKLRREISLRKDGNDPTQPSDDL